MPKLTTEEAAALAERTKDAFAASLYEDWGAAVEVLTERGLTLKHAEAIIRSKHMRWAADSGMRAGKATVADLNRYLDDMRNARALWSLAL